MIARVLHIVLLLVGVCQGKLIPDREITEALNVLVSLDERLDGHAKINYQNMASRKDFTHDNAKEPLFTSVAQRALNGATYKAFKNLISFYNEPDVDVPETVTSDWEAAIDSFLDAVTNTTVMRSTKEFLTSKGVVSDDESFRNLLYTMWFTQYARGHAVGSSGFESVFSGEIRGNDVIRFNNWFRFYELETAGQVNYHGWYTREKNIEMSLQFEWNNWKAMDTSMLLNTSPEFEMAVYTICALGKGQCKMNIGRVQVQIFAKTIKQNDIVLIDHCYPGAASPAPSPAPTRRPTEKTRRPRPTEKPEPTGWPTERTRRPRPTEKPHGSDFQVLVDKMRAADVDKAGPGDLILHWGKKTQVGLENEQSNSDELFVYVNETLFERPVYATLIEVYKRKLFTPEVCGKEAEMNGFRKAQLQQVFDTWTSTEVFRLAADYLREKEFKYASDMKTLKEYLWNLWFGTYTRCRGPSGSSGWEHVFVGEWKGKTIDGHHDWVGYYLLQKADRVHYRGYYTYVDNLIGTVQYTWDNHVKPKGGFLIGTSPAFDFSLFSVCAILHPGSNGCRYKIDGHPLGVTSFKQSCSAGTCLATAYPTA